MIELDRIDDRTLRATFRDPDGTVLSVWEGPFRTIMQMIVQDHMGKDYAIRKVR